LEHNKGQLLQLADLHVPAGDSTVTVEKSENPISEEDNQEPVDGALGVSVQIAV
jgi:hypothetical protein